MDYVLKYISQGIKVFACNQNKTPAKKTLTLLGDFYE